MKIEHAATPSPEAQEALEILRQAVRDALEKKRRLGQYAIVWRDGKPVRIEGDELRAEEPPHGA